MVGQPQMQSLSYKTPDDYVAIIGLISVYPMLVVEPDSPWKTFPEFLAAAKASPGKLRVGTPGAGSLHHMNLAKLEKLSGAQFTMVPFAGFGEMGPAVMGGHVESIIALPGDVKPHVDAGKMRLLGMFQPTRNSFFPDLPTFKEMGFRRCLQHHLLPRRREGDAARGGEVSARHDEGGDRRAPVHRVPQGPGA